MWNKKLFKEFIDEGFRKIVLNTLIILFWLIKLLTLQNKDEESTAKMDIAFKSTKACKCYQAFVEDPTNRAKRRAFGKMFGGIEEESVKLHKRLLSFADAGAYNRIYGGTNNRIELKRGDKKEKPLILKTRVTGSWRKFFHNIATEAGDFLLVRDWLGNFDKISAIYVIDVNNHDYNAV
ncbi:MAG: hypothetical protein ACI31A_01080 [Candidatus Limisoma sp.]